MRTKMFLLLFATLTACEYDGSEGGFSGGAEGGTVASGGGGEGGEGGEGGGGTSSTGGTCNNANESCTSGTCSGEGSIMLPGATCQNCHGNNFSIAGTVFSDSDGGSKSSGATIFITDSTGKSVTLTSNSVGNFYSTSSMRPPLTAEIDQNGWTMAMSSQATTGACNSCHKCGGAAGGKLYAN